MNTSTAQRGWVDFLEGLELPPAFGWELPQLKQDASAIGADDGRFQHSPSLLRRGPTASPTRVAHASQSPTESPTWRSSEACAVVTPGSVRSRDTAACAVPSAPAPKRSRVLTASNTGANAWSAPSTAAAAFIRAGAADRDKLGPRGGRSAAQAATVRRKQTPRAEARAPQKPLAFNLFNREHRLELKQTHPEWSEAQRKAEIQKRWSEMATQDWFKTKHAGYQALLKGALPSAEPRLHPGCFVLDGT
mgnify:CR=1 FL=1